MADARTFGRPTLGANGAPNKLFLAFLFNDPDVGVQGLKDVGLIPSSMVYCTYGSQITWRLDTSVKDGYRQQCWRAIPASACSASTSIGHGSWFQQSNLNFAEVFFLTYDIVRSYEHVREHLAASEGIPQSLQPDGGLHLSPGQLHVCGGMLIPEREPLHTLSASLPAWAGAPHLPSMQVMSPNGLPSPHYWCTIAACNR